jgi:hypothetical protein
MTADALAGEEAPRYSAAATLDAVAAGAAPGLVAPAAWSAVRRVAARLPAPLLQAFYLECRLAPRAPRVDWIVRVDAPGREILAGRNPRLRLPAPLRAHPAWARLADFCAAWEDEPLLRALVKHLWLEFDTGDESEDAGWVPVPSVFVSFDLAATAPLPPAEWRALATRVMHALRPGASEATREAVLAAIARRPEGAGVPYLGFMLARAGEGVRVYLSGVPAAALPAALRDCGWPGDAAPLAALLERAGGVAAPAPYLTLAHVDVEGAVLPPVGVEYRLRHAGQKDGLAEAPFLERLVEMGACAPERRRALEGWAGAELRTLPHELWPSRIARRVNHVKLVHRPGAEVEAKAYLQAAWRAAAARREGAHPPAATAGAH